MATDVRPSPFPAPLDLHRQGVLGDNFIPPTPRTLQKIMSTSLSMSLATLTGDDGAQHAPFDFWQPDDPLLRQALDQPNEPLPLPILPAITENADEIQSSADNHVNEPVVEAIAKHLEATANSEAGPIRSHRNSLSNGSDSVVDSSTESSRSRSIAEEASYTSNEAQYPIVPPADYVVRNGVRLTSTGKPSHARKVPANHIKRPRNAFILFRSHACLSNLVPPELNITDHRHISRIVGNLWKSLPPEEKRVWEEMAEKEKEEHRRQNPDYKYRPVYRRDGAVRRRKKKEQEIEEVADEERKCEVVAKVLLEGGDVDETRLKEQVEIQKQKDEEEGRQRGIRKTRSPARQSRSQSRPFQDYIEQQDYANQMTFFDYGEPIYQNTRSRRNGGANQNSLYDLDASAFIPLDQQNLYSQDYFNEINPFQDPNEYTYSVEMPPPLLPASRLRKGPPMPLGLGNMSYQNTAPTPATPRTLAMQQYQEQMNEKMRNPAQLPLLSPNASSFGLRSPSSMGGFGKNIFAVASERNTSFDPGMLTNMHLERGDSIDPSLHQSEPLEEHALRDESQVWPSNEQYSNPAQSTNMNALLQEHHVQPYSSFGELAASSAVPGTAALDQANSMSFVPDGEVQYVYLAREQAQDAALVESIRRAGFGITFDI